METSFFALPLQIFTETTAENYREKLFDNLNGSGLLWERYFTPTAKKPAFIKFVVSWHNMDDHGGYDGYNYYTVKMPVIDTWVFPELLTITGQRGNKRKYDDTKDFLVDILPEQFRDFYNNFRPNFRTGEISERRAYPDGLGGYQELWVKLE